MSTTNLNEAPNSYVGSRTPACDACKARKTRCDRKSPCSTCATAMIPCLTTRRPSEKRPRILLSSKYDSALENVHHRLQDITENLKTLVENDKVRSQTARTSIPFQQTPIDGDSLEGYNGDSSFGAYASSVAKMLETASTDSLASRQVLISPSIHEMLLDLRDAKPATKACVPAPPLNAQAQFHELKDLQLPDREFVLKLLRLVTVEKHRFFVDIPIIDEQELIHMCQNIYFSVEPPSSLTWSIVNAGLLYLLFGLDDHLRAELGMSATDIQANIKQLSANTNIAIQSLKLCLEPSILTCQALGLLGMLCINTGRSPIAWRLITTASQMCLDMGFHRLPRNTKDDDVSRKKLVLFWWMYAMNTGLAFTFGRTPTIHDYDVTSRRPSFPEDFPGVPKLYSGYIEYAIIAGDIHQRLFSASSQREDKGVLVSRAKAFASELIRIQDSFKPKPEDQPLEAMFKHTAIALDIIMYCLLAVVYRIIPPNKPATHPLQCCDECVGAARKALTIIVQVGQELQSSNPEGWSMLLNLIISLVPFVSFIVLIGNTIATTPSHSDMALLSSTLSVLKPVGESSPAAQNLFEICQKFYRIAETLESKGQAKVLSKSSDSNDDLNMEASVVDTADWRYPMSQQDWDDVVKDFEMDGINTGEMATLLEPYNRM